MDQEDSKEKIVEAVLKMNYRMLDCASFYHNQKLVGEAWSTINQNGIKREDLFMVSKVWWDEVDDVENACRQTLKDLQLEYLDLYLVHWPIAMKTIKNDDGTTSYERMKVPMHKVWE